MTEHTGLPHREAAEIWYKEPWPWFIILILLVSFSWGIFQLSVAFSQADDEVIDDYYVEGRMVNLALQRDQLALALGMQARLIFDKETGEINVELQGQISQWPEKLRMSFLSPTSRKSDTVLTIIKTPAGHYSGFLEHELAGQFYVQLEPVLEGVMTEQDPDDEHREADFPSGAWRLNTRLKLESDKTDYVISAD